MNLAQDFSPGMALSTALSAGGTAEPLLCRGGPVAGSMAFSHSLGSLHLHTQRRRIFTNTLSVVLVTQRRSESMNMDVSLKEWKPQRQPEFSLQKHDSCSFRRFN